MFINLCKYVLSVCYMTDAVLASEQEKDSVSDSGMMTVIAFIIGEQLYGSFLT